VDYMSAVSMYDDIVIFGYADLGKYLYKELSKHFPGKNIIVCDNFLHKFPSSFCAENIISVEQAVLEFPNALYIPTSIYHREMMIEQLRNMEEFHGEIMVDDALFFFEKKRQQLNRCTTRKHLVFEVDIARHCNLNCRGCLHFSPLSKPKFLDISSYQKDICRLSKVFGGQAEKISLMGGEPLLNPDIIQYVKIARTYFPNAKLLILTNGVLLDRMPEEFFYLV